MSLPDIRQSSKSSKEHRRYHNQKAKWSKGTRPLPGLTHVREDGRCRPQPSASNYDHRSELGTIHRSSTASRKFTLRHDVQEAIATRRDSFLTDVDENEAAAAAASAVLYSFDAPRSPEDHAEQILSLAVAQALDRFETKETEKIVREYEIVDSQSEEDSAHDEEDYEFV